MDIFINILVPILCLLIGYIFGAIPTSIWVGKVFYHQDPRDFGSHNAGGTNAGRLWGKKVGFCIILIDMIKTIGPMWLCWAILTYCPMYNGKALCSSIEFVDSSGINSSYPICYPVYWLAALGAMIGHCWPIFAKFRGGKGVSVFMGLVVGSSWMIGFIPGLIYFLVLKLTKYVSLAGIITCIISSIVAWIWAILCMTNVVPRNLMFLPMYGINLIPNFIYAILITLLAIILIARHHENISRIKQGNERKIKWMK